VVRSLAIDYTFDPKIYDGAFQNQFFFGQALLIAPFESGKELGKVYLPRGKWYELYNDNTTSGASETTVQLQFQKLPVYVKESSIVPMQSLIQSTAEKPTDTLVLHIYNGSSANSFVYYEDDGISFDYEKGQYYKREITFDPLTRNIKFGKTDGSLKSKFNKVKLILHGFEKMNAINLNGKKNNLNEDFISFLSPISQFDPQGNAGATEGCKVQTITIQNESNSFTVNY
jgi:alpha-glucosidase